jgi:CheY-like chemotaxis protein
VTESGAARKRDDDPAKSFPPSRWHQAPLPHKRPQPRARRAGLVLIADDTRDSRELYGLYLSHQGFAVELASDGAAAVDAAIKLRPDVIVMDLSMPQLDGIAATIRLKAHPRTHRLSVQGDRRRRARGRCGRVPYEALSARRPGGPRAAVAGGERQHVDPPRSHPKRRAGSL